MNALESLQQKIYGKKLFILFTWITRILLFLGFLPSGLKKLLGEPFTILGLDSPVGFFFEALFRTGFYWNFLGLMQLIAGLLLLIPRTAYLGAILYFPIILNIFIIVVAMNFKGTPFVAGLMLIANLYLLFWDYKKTKQIASIIFER
jgi:uncharacterized membrane protein YphA (DoxX/SURF4 family)